MAHNNLQHLFRKQCDKSIVLCAGVVELQGMGADLRQQLMSSLEEQELLNSVDVHATAVSPATSMQVNLTLMQQS